MKKVYTFCSILFLGMVFAVSAGLLNTKKAESGLSITAPDGYAVGCNTNFTRIMPHFCLKTTGTTVGTMTLDGTCRAFSGMGLDLPPAGAKAILVNMPLSLNASGAVSTRQITLTLFTNNVCSLNAIGYAINWLGKEWVIAGAGTNMIALNPNMITMSKAVGTADAWYLGTLTNCANCTLGYSIQGYYD